MDMDTDIIIMAMDIMRSMGARVKDFDLKLLL